MRGQAGRLPRVALAPRRGAPLVGRLAALVAAVALPLLGIAAWGVWTGQDSLRQQREQALLRRVQGIALTVEREFDRADALLQALSASAALARGELDAFEEEMRAASATVGGAPVTLVGADGMILVSTTSAPGARLRGVAAPAEARRLIADGRTQVINLFDSQLGGGLTVAVALRLSGRPPLVPAGVAPGGIGVSLPRQAISTLLREASGLDEASAANGWTASIVDRAGVAVARSGAEEGIVGRPVRASTFVRLQTLREGLDLETTTRDGIPAIAAVTRGPRSGFAFILTTPQAEFTAPLRAAMLRTLVAGGLVLALGLALAALLARRTVAAFRIARAAAASEHAPPTGLREADDLARALAAAAADRARAESALTASERRNREVLESLGERLFALDAQGRIRFASRAALQGWGVGPDHVLGRHFEEAFPEAAESPAWKALRLALAERRETHLCAVSALIERWIEIDAYPAAEGGMTVAFRDIDDLREAYQGRSRVAEALQASEERLRMAMDAAELGAWEVDLRAGTIRCSPRTLEIVGFEGAPEVASYPIWRERIHPEDRPAALAAIRAVTEGEADGYTTAYRFLRPDGRPVWIESHARVVARDPATRRALRVIGTSRDITARRAGEERQALLAREVDHRAKNALAVVQAAVRLTPKDDAASFAQAIEGRVGALARAQTLLAADRWNAADLGTLLEGELAAFPADGAPRAVLEGPSVALPAAMTQPLAMAVHELATNAVKHGALSTPDGVVTVTWKVEPAPNAGPPTLRLRWVERGGPALAGQPARRGFGSRVLDGTIRGQLGGTVTVDWAEAGLRCEMTVPLRPSAPLRQAVAEPAEMQG
jgi:PAS domain S-box-containing protein